MPTLLLGTLDLLILKALSLQPLHGLGVARRIEQVTAGAFEVKAGSLFPALYRMEESGWLSSAWGTTDTNRKVRFYRLTAAGKRQLGVEAKEWEKVAAAMAMALRST
jgi:PadR family transcriptional regulator, regulatory protein PadR